MTAPAGPHDARDREPQASYTVPPIRNSVPPIRDFVPVVVRPKRQCNHVLHLILTLLSCGLWAPVWVVDAIICAASRAQVEYR